jgi:glycogen phosphorylase
MELALDLRWAWNHSADELWAVTHNPWVVLQTVSRTKLESFLARPEYTRARDRSCVLRARRTRHPHGLGREDA